MSDHHPLVDELIRRRAELRQESEDIKDELEIAARATATGNGGTPQEVRRIARLERRAERLRDEAREYSDRIDELNEEHVREQRAAMVRAEAGSVGHQSAYVTRDEAIYRPDGEHSFFMDMRNARAGDWAAAERLHRNEAQMGVERRALGSGAAGTGGTFAPPLWAIQSFVDYALPGRVVADRVNKQPLPAGVSSVNLPRIASPASVAVQTAQNTALSQTDITTDSVSSGISTVGGKQVVSLQLIEQSPPGPGFDQVVFKDLAAAWAQAVETQVISGTNTAGQVLGILNVAGVNAVTYTSTAPAVVSATRGDSFYSQVLNATNQVFTGIYAAPDTLVVHPRRWAWCLGGLDGQARPQIVASGTGNQLNSPGISTESRAQGAVGVFAGLNVYVSAGVPTNLGTGTNQDVAVVMKADEVYTYENEVRFEAFDAPYADSAAILLRCLSYLASVPHRRPKAISTISGTGMVAPTTF